MKGKGIQNLQNLKDLQDCHDLQKKRIFFILYLNNADGDTVLKEPINKKITPEKGKVIVFDGTTCHNILIHNGFNPIWKMNHYFHAPAFSHNFYVTEARIHF